MSLISSAYAADTAAVTHHQNGFGSFIFIIGFFVIFYFMMVRPQMKRAKQHKDLMSSLSVGDEIVTNGGVAGRITDVQEDFITLEIAENTTIKVQKPAVSQTLPKGTL